MSMGKNKRSPLTQMVGMPHMPDCPPEATITQAEGGFSMKTRGKHGYASEKHSVHKTLHSVHQALKAHFGAGSSTPEETAEASAGQA